MTTVDRARPKRAAASRTPENAIWKADFRNIDPVALRMARYTLRLLQVDAKTFDRTLNDLDELRAAWNLVAPLFDDDAAAAVGSDVREDDDLALVLEGAQFGEHLGRSDAHGGRADLAVGVLEG